MQRGKLANYRLLGDEVVKVVKVVEVVEGVQAVQSSP